MLRIIVHYRNYSLLHVLSVTGHTGSKGDLEKPVLQAKFCVKPDKMHNRLSTVVQLFLRATTMKFQEINFLLLNTQF